MFLDVVVDCVLKDWPWLDFMLWLLRDVSHRQNSLPQSFQTVVGWFKHDQENFTRNVGRNGQVGVSWLAVPNSAISAPKLADNLV